MVSVVIMKLAQNLNIFILNQPPIELQKWVIAFFSALFTLLISPAPT